MRHLCLAAAWGLIAWGCSLCSVSLSASSAPRATPTSVLPLPARSPARVGLYRSPLAPYSVASAWPGHPVIDPGGTYDLFEGDGAEIVVLTEPNRRHLNALGAEQHLRTLIIQENMTPFLISSIEVGGQHHVAVLAFSGPDGVFAAATFVAAQRVWVVQLSTTYTRQEQDWQVLQRFLQSVRLENASVPPGNDPSPMLAALILPIAQLHAYTSGIMGLARLGACRTP